MRSRLDHLTTRVPTSVACARTADVSDYEIGCKARLFLRDDYTRALSSARCGWTDPALDRSATTDLPGNHPAERRLALPELGTAVATTGQTAL